MGEWASPALRPQDFSAPEESAFGEQREKPLVCPVQLVHMISDSLQPKGSKFGSARAGEATLMEEETSIITPVPPNKTRWAGVFMPVPSKTETLTGKGLNQL